MSSSPSPNETDVLPRIGDLIGGKFRITETLGQGGMGVVLGGEHLDLRQAVAIKVLRPSLAKEPDALARFLREARAAASIKSRHAVRIHDVGTTEAGVPYMVMERLNGIGVDALLEEQGALSVEQAVTIVVQAAEAIAEANGIGIVHRDVKPSNLFLATDSSGAPIVKVLDFGISKRRVADDGHESASLTAPQTLLGSPSYMSPEQLRDPRSVDERTDVWGLGVTLYELATGRLPFESESIPELCALIFTSTHPRADVVRPEVPAALADVIEQCLVKDAVDRIPGAAALVAKLVPFCRGEIAATAEKLGRTAISKDDTVLELRAPPSRGSRRLVAVGATAATVAVGLALFLRGRGETVTATNGAAMVSSATSASASVGPSSSVAGATSVQDAANVATPAEAGSPVRAATSSSPSTASTPASPRPTGTTRPAGLKGIKLMD